MTDLVNSNVINSLLNEKQFNKEFKAMLNELIDAELEKDINEMDCDLIEDLTDMLIELEQSEDDGFPVIIPLTNAKKIISACSVHNFKSLSRGMKVSLIACIILLSGITCNAAVYQITGNNIAQNIVDSINQKLTDWGIITYADSSDTVVDEVPTGSENLDAGFDNDEETTTKPTENPTEKPTAKPVTTKPEVTGSENLDTGFDDDDEEPTKPEVKPAVKQYKITFDANGGICNTKEKTISYKSSIGDLPTPIRAGYVFGGWYNIDISYKFNNYSGIVPFKEALPIKADTIYNIARDATLTAKWYELSTVTFDPGLGTCDIKTMQVNSEGKITNIPVPVRKGYIFDYWYYTKKDGSTFKTVILTTDLLITENMTFKPHWTTAQTDFTITFDANGGECDTQTKPVVLGEPCGELPVPTRSGYTFIGWYGGKDTDSTHYTDETIYNTRNNLTFYAIWGQNTVTVTFDADGGECDTKTAEYYCSLAFGDLPVPTKPGYIFKYWHYDIIGVDIEVYNDTTVTQSMDGITLTAKWAPARIDITFDPNGGYLDDTFSKKYYYNAAYGALPKAYLKGFEFDGWFTEPEGGEKIETDSIVQSYEPITLYAHWTEVENSVGVTVHTNRSVESTYDLTYKIGDKLGDIPKPDATTSTEKSYTTFIGWYDDRHYGNKLSSDTVVTEDMNIYAHWKMSGMITTDIRIKGLKSVYNLGEEINLDNATFQLKVGTIFGIGAEPVDITELLYNDTIPFEEHLTGVDTSTVGEHKITVIFAMDETTISGCGTLTMTGSFTYNVVDCEHKNTTIKKYRAPRCDYEGYTGDTYCKDCDYFLESGESIPKTPHSDTTVILYDKKPTCTEEGYTGNISCSNCHQCLKKGETIPALGHGEAKLYNVKEVSCGHNGYTGDLCCSVCLEVLEKGEVIPKYPHSGKTELVGVKEVTCGHDGYTGDVVCADCGEIFEKGEVLPKYPHPSERVYYPYQEPTCGSSGNAWVACAECGHVFGTTTLPPLPHGKEVLVTVDPTCTQNGYTYYVCEVCGHFIREGEEIPKLGHRNTELRNAKAATCTEDGYSGDTYCNDCGKTIQKGSVINKLGHKYVYVNEKAELDKDGFRGKQCEHCNDRQPGTVYNAIASIELDEPVLYYSGKPIAPDVKVLDTAGKVITSYNIELPDGRQEVGTYTIKLTFTGNYQGTHYLTYEIKERTSGITNIEKVPTGIVVNWMAAGSADGYEIKLVNAANEKTIRTVDISDGSTSAKININKNLDVYVVIRSYKKTTVNSEETVVYSDWSDKFYVNR